MKTSEKRIRQVRKEYARLKKFSSRNCSIALDSPNLQSTNRSTRNRTCKFITQAAYSVAMLACLCKKYPCNSAWHGVSLIKKSQRKAQATPGQAHGRHQSLLYQERQQALHAVQLCPICFLYWSSQQPAFGCAENPATPPPPLAR